MIHPQTAKEHGILDGEKMVIATRRGRIEQKAGISPRVLPGVVHASHGWWFPEAGEEKCHEWDRANYNILTRGDNPRREYGTLDLKGVACRIGKGPLHVEPMTGR